LLRQKLARQNELIHKLAGVRKQLTPMLSTGGLKLLEHLDLERRLDRKWLQRLLADVESGRVRDVADPRRLAPE
jgi:hypothetical protein